MLFLIGNPRSGTSLFRLLMTSHSDIHVPPECGFLIWWREKYGNWSEADNPVRMDEFLDDFFNSKKIEFWDLERDELKAYLEKVTPKTYADLGQAIYAFHAAKTEKQPKHLGDKNNFHLSHIANLAALYPNAKFIHIIRDGRDVATSYMTMNTIKSGSAYKPNLPSDIADIAEEWQGNIKTVRAGFAELDDWQSYEIRYEDLVEDTEKTLTGICRFLNLSYEPEMLEYYLANAAGNLEPEEFMAWKARTRGKIDNAAIGKYREWPEEDIALFEEKSADILRIYGYPLHS